ncbi:hypothetical protein, variant 2 [Aphanomyces invadans]|nr:hypothetical protein, variant 2 [Aphanomyces invadans]ETV97851.1 hypothetical protein, variant 2 [Aphanomyces invadans]|eukprot:XP_008873412.1 hypothetical protein, variant 2 [Aphanomyces invadans]
MEMDLQNYTEARRLFSVILATETSDSLQAAMATLGLALVEDRCGNTDKARRMFVQATKRFPEDLHVAEAYALFEGRHGNVMLARQLLSAASERGDSTPQVFHAWAYLEFRRGNFRDALTIIDRGLLTDPYDKPLLMLRALTLAKMGDNDGAREAFMKHTKFARGDARAYNAYAQFEEESGNFEVAQNIYHSILKQHPTSASNITGLAYLHVKMDPKEGVEHGRETFATGVTVAVDNAQLWHSWGVFEERYGTLELAKRLFTEATEKAPWAADYWCSLARVESKLGDPKAMRVTLDKATMTCSNKLPLLVTLAKLELKNRCFKEAREACVAALKIDKKRPSTWNLRALVELTHHPERAKGIVENALKIVPTHDHVSWGILLCTYARCYVAMGDYDNAAASFREAIRLDGGNYHTHLYLANFMEKVGELEEAKKRYEMASLLCPSNKVHLMGRNIASIDEQLAQRNADV